MTKKRVIAMIPARMESSRFPGKPLARILELPMIEHVRRRVALSEKDCPETRSSTWGGTRRGSSPASSPMTTMSSTASRFCAASAAAVSASTTSVMINADCEGRIDIGPECLIGPNVVLRTSNHFFQTKKFPLGIRATNQAPSSSKRMSGSAPT